MKKNIHTVVSFFCCVLLLIAFIYSYERYGVNFISTLSQPKLSFISIE